MGYNTTVVVYNDALHEIENDQKFGKKLAQAIRRANMETREVKENGYHRVIDIPSGSHANAAIVVVETHRADEIVLVAVWANLGQRVGSALGVWRLKGKDLLKAILDRMGFTLLERKQ